MKGLHQIKITIYIYICIYKYTHITTTINQVSIVRGCSMLDEVSLTPSKRVYYGQRNVIGKNTHINSMGNDCFDKKC